MRKKKQFHIATSPLSNTIFVGHTLKDGNWSSDKEDMTIQALVAVADHVLNFGKPVIISDNEGPPLYEITVKNITTD